MVSRLFEISQREFQRSFKGVSSVFKGSFKGVPSNFLRCSKEVSRVFQESFKGTYLNKVARYFKGVSVVSSLFERSKGEFQRSLKDVLSFKVFLRKIEVCSERYSMLYQGRFNEVSMVFIDSVKCGTRKFHKSFKSV